MKKFISIKTRSFHQLALAVCACLLTLGVSTAEARGVPSGAVDGGPELKCLALNIYFEARSEPEAGKYAVGHVVMNRVAHKRFPKSICRVIRQGGYKRRHRCQFSWWCDGKNDLPRDKTAWEESRRIAVAIYDGASEDPTDGALWYHADYVKPNWRSDFQRGPKIGRHIFYAIENMKRDNARTMETETASSRMAAISPGAGPAELNEPNTSDKKFVISGDDFSKKMLMVFGVGLMGVGFAGTRRKSR